MSERPMEELRKLLDRFDREDNRALAGKVRGLLGVAETVSILETVSDDPRITVSEDEEAKLRMLDLVSMQATSDEAMVGGPPLRTNPVEDWNRAFKLPLHSRPVVHHPSGGPAQASGASKKEEIGGLAGAAQASRSERKTKPRKHLSVVLLANSLLLILVSFGISRGIEKRVSEDQGEIEKWVQDTNGFAKQLRCTSEVTWMLTSPEAQEAEVQLRLAAAGLPADPVDPGVLRRLEAARSCQ